MIPAEQTQGADLTWVAATVRLVDDGEQRALAEIVRRLHANGRPGWEVRGLVFDHETEIGVLGRLVYFTRWDLAGEWAVAVADAIRGYRLIREAASGGAPGRFIQHATALLREGGQADPPVTRSTLTADTETDREKP